MSFDTQAIIDAARLGAEPSNLMLGGYYIVPTANGDVRTFDLTGDEYRDQPRHKTGTVTVTDVPSFLAVYGKHASPDAEVYADRTRGAVTAILDAHTPFGGVPQWQGHRAVLHLKHTEAFNAWSGINGKYMSQTSFAEFIEDRRADIVEPAAADVLELAQTFQATTKVDFKSSSILKSGQRQLSYVESVAATAGQRGDMTIPDHLQLAIAVYEGATVADAVTARLRFRINDGKLNLAVILDQLSDVVHAAFEGVIADVQAGVPVPVLRGTPT